MVRDKRELEFKQDGQEYGQALRLLGNGRVEVYCMDGKKRTATIRGAMKQRVWINNGDIVLLTLRDFGTDDKCDIVMKYYDEEARELQELGEIPEHIKIAEGRVDMDDDQGDGDSDDEEGEERKEDFDIDNIWTMFLIIKALQLLKAL